MFFLNESKEEQEVKVVKFNEASLTEDIHQSTISLLTLESEYKDIVMESVQEEAQIYLGEADEEEGEQGRGAKAVEAIKNFFTKMLDFFKRLAGSIAQMAKNVMDKVKAKVGNTKKFLKENSNAIENGYFSLSKEERQIPDYPSALAELKADAKTLASSVREGGQAENHLKAAEAAVERKVEVGSRELTRVVDAAEQQTKTVNKDLNEAKGKLRVAITTAKNGQTMAKANGDKEKLKQYKDEVTELNKEIKAITKYTNKKIEYINKGVSATAVVARRAMRVRNENQKAGMKQAKKDGKARAKAEKKAAKESK